MNEKLYMYKQAKDRATNSYLIDIFVAHNEITKIVQKYTNDQNLYTYNDWHLTIIELIKLGEATKNLLLRKFFEKSNLKKAIVKLRNIIAHEYFGVRRGEVWKIVSNRLPEYINELKYIIKTDQIDMQEAIKKHIEEEKSETTYQENPEIIAFLNELSQELCLNKENKKRKLRR